MVNKTNAPMGTGLDLSENELVIDLFAGGGGASAGISAAIGRDLDAVVEWCPVAAACHAVNYPKTQHIVADVTTVDPHDVCKGRPVGLLWLSPPCTEFSRGKNGKPRNPDVLNLADVGLTWASAVRPRVIIMENVPEVLKWGPLGEDNLPIEGTEGDEFQRWLSELRALGYTIDWRTLVAADYGTPTTRERMFVIARCDGEPIQWPAPTHGPGLSDPWNPVSECIDWSIDNPSIFTRKRPLVDASLVRIAKSILRNVISDNGRYIVRPLSHESGDTVVAAGMIKYYGTGHGFSLTEPAHTITTNNHFGLYQVTLKRAVGPGDKDQEVRTLMENRSEWEGAPGPVTAEINGETYAVTDVGLRMLRYHELAKAQGFPETYRFVGDDGSPLTESKSIAIIGNSVCPQVAEALVRSQLDPTREKMQ